MLRMPASSGVRHLGDDPSPPSANVTTKCESTGCFSTGAITFLVGGVIGLFVGANLGSLVGAAYAENRRRVRG